MTPTFAVVGHPNKGKSSIVATLAHDDSIAISAQSGTTKVAERLTVEVGQCSYVLIDTPGFQRPTRVLQWLNTHAASAEQRQNAVQQFIRDPDCQRDFPDEVQLLTPVVEGAAILYVVDGGRPFSVDYEAEMEILRWTGQASLALINPIGNADFTQQWQQALSQYFKVVKVFNAMDADFDKQMSILETFSLLRDDWRQPIRQLIEEYQRLREGQRRRSLHILTTMLLDMCSYQVSRKVLNRQQAAELRSKLETRYYQEMQQKEQKAWHALQQVHGYLNLNSHSDALPVEENLFDTEKWIVWGLNRQQLLVAATMAGAATGAVVDLGLAGHSLFLGAIGGGLLGAGSAWIGADKLADFKLQGLPLGGYEARQGPIRNRNFPYVLLNRYLFLEQALRQRTHARRDILEIREGDLSERLDTLESSQQKALHVAMNRLSRQKTVDNLPAVLAPLLQ